MKGGVGREGRRGGERGTRERKSGRGGLSQTDDQILRPPVRELESMKESDACLKTQWQPKTL